MGKFGILLICFGLLAYFSTVRAASLEDVVAKHKIGSSEGYERLLSSVSGSTPSRKLKQQGFDLNVALIDATARGDTSAVQLLLNAGADPNYVEYQGLLSPLVAAAFKNQASLVPLLVQAGALVKKEVNGRTALWVAVNSGSADTARALIAAGADPNSVMHMAAARNEAAVLQVLIQGGGDVNLEKDGFPVLVGAAFVGSEEAIDVLVRNGADTTNTGGKDSTPREVLCQCTLLDGEVDLCQYKKCESPQRMISLLTSRSRTFV